MNRFSRSLPPAIFPAVITFRFPLHAANMPARVSEAFVLQTWPFKEGDLIVSFLTRDLGKLRGVARRARRPKSGFGSGLERLSHIRMSYFQRENRELVNIDSCDLLHSQFAVLNDFASACALDFFAEVSEQLLPAAEPNEKYFRLITAVLDDLRSSANAWRAVTLLQRVGSQAGRIAAGTSRLSGMRIVAGPRASGSRVLQPPARGTLLPRLPPCSRSSRNMGTRAGIPRHCRRNPAYTDRTAAGSPAGARPRRPICAVSSHSKWNPRSSASSLLFRSSKPPPELTCHRKLRRSRKSSSS